MGAGSTFYLLRSRLTGAQGLGSATVCASIEDMLARLSGQIVSMEAIVSSVACVGPPEELSRARTLESVRPLLERSSREVEWLRAVPRAPVILLETIPCALFDVPSLQDWRELQTAAAVAYHLAECFNDGLRTVAAAHGVWLLDCDRAVSRKGVRSDGGPVEPDCFERELWNILHDAYSGSDLFGSPV